MTETLIPEGFVLEAVPVPEGFIPEVPGQIPVGFIPEEEFMATYKPVPEARAFGTVGEKRAYELDPTLAGFKQPKQLEQAPEQPLAPTDVTMVDIREPEPAPTSLLEQPLEIRAGKDGGRADQRLQFIKDRTALITSGPAAAAFFYQPREVEPDAPKSSILSGIEYKEIALTPSGVTRAYIPTAESVLKVTNQFIKDNITGEPLSIEQMEEGKGMVSGVAHNIWTTAKTVGSGAFALQMRRAPGGGCRAETSVLLSE